MYPTDARICPSNPLPYAIMSGDLQFKRRCLTLIRGLATGTFGPVYLAAAEGILNTGVVTEVVIKTLKGKA